MKNTKTSPLIYGTILCSALTINSLVQILLEEYNNKIFSTIFFVIIFIGAALISYWHAKENEFTLSYGKIVSHGFKSSIIAGIIGAVLFILLYKFVFTDVPDKIKAVAIADIDINPKTKNLPESSKEYIRSITAKSFEYFYVILIFTWVIFSALIGLVASLISAAFIPKNRIIEMDAPTIETVLEEQKEID